MSTVEIKGFPMPPSSNRLYANGINGGRFKTQSYKAFEHTVHYWALKNQHILNYARDLADRIPAGYALQIDRIYFFKPHKIVTKDGKPRKNDTSNRIKALDDVLAALLGIGDEYFWDGVYQKRAIETEGLDERVDIKLTLIAMNESNY